MVPNVAGGIFSFQSFSSSSFMNKNDCRRLRRRRRDFQSEQRRRRCEAMRGSTESVEGGEGVAVELFEALQECSRV